VFESYAAFKSWLGRSTVDLRGPKAPHMLQGIITKVRGAAELVIGVYGVMAARAQRHNEGDPKRKLPRRHWFAASVADQKKIVLDVYARMKSRLRGK
jgi:hypothetical protein